MRKLKDLPTGSLLIHENSLQVYFETYKQQSVKTLKLKPEEGEISQESLDQLVLTEEKEKQERALEMDEIAKARAERQFR